MKSNILILIILLTASDFLFSQNLRWSYSVINTGSTSRVTLRAQKITGGTENVYSFNYGFYYKSSEATIVGTAANFSGNLTTTQYNNAVDDSAAEGMGWVTDGTGSVAIVSTPPAGLPSGYNRLFIGQLADGDGVGENVGSGPLPFLDLIFDVTPGTGAPDDDSVYIADFNNSAGFTYSAITFDEFPVFTIGDRLQALPIVLVAFDAKKYNDRSSYLSWSTSSEINSSHFNIQRSLDKKTWTNIGKINAAGNSQIIRNYEFMDENVYNGKDLRLTAYYRLEMVDLDGQKNVSPIKDVVFGNSSTAGREIAFYPNPSSDGLQIEWDASRVDQPTLIEFFDVQGNMVYTSKVSDNTNQLYVDYGQTSIIPGLYIMRILSGAEIIDHKQIVVTSR